MKALGIPQPGAWLIINGYYDRVPLPKPTKFRGPILVYALGEPVAPLTFEQFVSGCRTLGVTSYPKINDFDVGGFLGTARFVRCDVDDAGAALGVLEDAEELGFVASSGRLGIFNVAENPFVSEDLQVVPYTSAPPEYAPHRARPTTSDDFEEMPTEPTFLDDLVDGIKQQTKNEVRKIGREVAKDAFSIGKDLLGGWLGGGKPRGGRRR